MALVVALGADATGEEQQVAAVDRVEPRSMAVLFSELARDPRMQSTT